MSNMQIPLKYTKDIAAAEYILKEYGATELYLFGSLAKGHGNANSDIDFAVRGLPESKFFAAYSKLEISLDHEVDLVLLDDGTDFSSRVQQAGGMMRVF